MKVKFGVRKDLYRAIKSVLGKKEAQYQLACVVESSCDLSAPSRTLSSAFRWVDTPQGFDYWSDVNQRIERL